MLRLLGPSLALAKCFSPPTEPSSSCQFLYPRPHFTPFFAPDSKSTRFCSLNILMPFLPPGRSTRFFLHPLKCLLPLKLHCHAQIALLRRGCLYPSSLEQLLQTLRLIVSFLSFWSYLFTYWLQRKFQLLVYFLADCMPPLENEPMCLPRWIIAPAHTVPGT